MNILLFWVPSIIIIASILYLLTDKDSGRLHWVVAQSSNLYIIIGICLLTTIWIGVSIGTAWVESIPIKQLLLTMWNNFSPLEMITTFFHHYDWIQITSLILLIVLFSYRVTISLYYNCTGLKDYKVISTYVESAWYYESWTERCTRTVTENGKTRTETYYVTHPPYWEAILGDETTISISSSDFKNYCNTFGDRKFKNMLRINQSSFGDGNAYYSEWPNTDATLIPAAYKQDYLNFITASKSTVLISNVDETKFNDSLSDDPSIEESPFGEIEIDRVTTTGILFDERVAQEIDNTISKWLAKIGTEKDVNVMFYFTDRDINFWYALHEVRQGGRFNEVLVVIGIDPILQTIDWCKTMAWDNNHLCSVIDSEIVALKTIREHHKICNVVMDAVERNWTPPNMDKYRYLASDIKLPWGYIILGVLCALVVCVPMLVYFYHHTYQQLFDDTVNAFKEFFN